METLFDAGASGRDKKTTRSSLPGASALRFPSRSNANFRSMPTIMISARA
jgi:hypothetical protein